MRIACHALSDVGRKRTGNEDSVHADLERGLFVVADGMGGHAAGEVASRVAVDAIGEFIAMTSGDQEITWPYGIDETISYQGNRLKTAVRHANRRVLEATRENVEYEGMATTVAAVLVEADTAHLAHVGDSRIYLWRRPGLELLTTDHSWVNEQVTSGILSAEQARHHPLRNVVTRALGGRAELLVEVQDRCVRPQDVLLLCSDGLTGMLTDAELARVLAASDGDLGRTAHELVGAANEQGGDDNISVILLRFGE